MENIVVVVNKDGVRVSGIERKPSGYADKLVERYVPTEGIIELPELPDKPEYYADTLVVWIYWLGLWVGFNRKWWQESSSGDQPMEEEIGQPFRVELRRLGHPSLEESKILAKEGVFYKWVDLYPKGQVCPSCGKQAVCYSQDIGAGNSFVDLYCLYCYSCNYTSCYEEYACEKDDAQEKSTTCKYCGRSGHEHAGLPEGLLAMSTAKLLSGKYTAGPIPAPPVETTLDAIIRDLQPILAEIVCKRARERIPSDLLYAKGVVCELLGEPCPDCSKGTLISYRSDSDSFLIHICLNPLCDYLKHLCPKCGANIKCSCIGEGGGADYSCTWVHTCTRSPDCDFRSHYSSFECNQGQLVVSGIEPSLGSCPGCGGNTGS